MLQKQDYVALCQYDREKGTLLLTDRLVIRDPLTIERLREAGLLIAKRGNKVTQKGKDLVVKLDKQMVAWKKGVPIAKRKDGDPTDAYLSIRKWQTATCKNQKVTTNGELLFTGDVPVRLANEKAATAFAKALPQSIKGLVKTKGYSKAVAVSWQLEGWSGFEMIWLKPKKGQMLAIQSRYYDFLKDRYPNADWYIPDRDRGRLPVQIRTRKKGHGLGNEVVAMVSVIALPLDWEVPKE